MHVPFNARFNPQQWLGIAATDSESYQGQCSTEALR
jgi:hypothetical protein